MILSVKIPKHLQHPLYMGNDNTTEIDSSKFQQWNEEGVYQLSYELLYEQNEKCFVPWENSEKIIPKLFAKWKSMLEQLESLYKDRNVKAAAPLMQSGIKLCMAIVFWHNERPINFQQWDRLEQLDFSLPVNFSERIRFIVSRPQLYASYKVLTEIMVELEKVVAKNNLKRKLKNK